MSDPLDLEAVGLQAVPQLDRAGRWRAAGQGETQLVDGEAQVLDLVDREPHPARQAGGGHTRQAKELRR